MCLPGRDAKASYWALSSPVALFLEETEEVWHERQHPPKLLQVHQRELADVLHHCPVLKLFCPHTQITTWFSKSLSSGACGRYTASLRTTATQHADCCRLIDVTGAWLHVPSDLRRLMAWWSCLLLSLTQPNISYLLTSCLTLVTFLLHTILIFIYVYSVIFYLILSL